MINLQKAIVVLRDDLNPTENQVKIFTLSRDYCAKANGTRMGISYIS